MNYKWQHFTGVQKTEQVRLPGPGPRDPGPNWHGTRSPGPRSQISVGLEIIIKPNLTYPNLIDALDVPNVMKLIINFNLTKPNLTNHF